MRQLDLKAGASLQRTRRTTAVEVRGIHTGLIANAGAYGAIATALAAQSARDDRRRTTRRAAVVPRGGVPSSSTQTSRLAA